MFIKIESDQPISELNIKFNSNGVVSSVITPVTSSPSPQQEQHLNVEEPVQQNRPDPRDDILNRQAAVIGSKTISDDVVMPVIPDISEREQSVDASFSNLNL
jgi:hypothetical protein